jgi:hypothetical protein
MRDLAALTPPLVMAVAFIAGVVVLLRKEMTPRRRDEMRLPDEMDLTRPETPPAGHSQMIPGPPIGDGGDGYADNSSNSDVSASGRREPPRHGGDAADGPTA